MPMPSVGMRRTTRVFVPKSVAKDADVVKVFRSRKQLLADSGEGKQGRGNIDEWLELLNDSGDVVSRDSCYYTSKDWVNVEPEHLEPEQVEVATLVAMENNLSGTDENRFGAVYNRKRRRPQQTDEDDRMFGIHYVRKKRRNGGCDSSSKGVSGDIVCPSPVTSLDVVLEFSAGTESRFTCFLVSFLNFARRSQLRLSLLSAFMCSEPIFRVFAQNGIHFLPGSDSGISRKNDIISSGFCRIFGVREFVPLISVNYSAIPLFFTNLHLSVSFTSLYLPDELRSFLMMLISKAHEVTDNERSIVCIPSEKSFSESVAVVSGKTISVAGEIVGLNGLSFFTEYGTNLLNIRKKRSSTRSRRVNFNVISHSSANVQVKVNQNGGKLCPPSISQLLGIGDVGKNHTKPARMIPRYNSKELKSTSVESEQSVDSLCCNATVLVIESDRCYRVEGAKVMLEYYSKVWHVVVKKQGVTKYVLKPQETLRPTTSNRFTHAFIWTGDDGWKLEFPEKLDWSIFKEIHTQCVSRNGKVHSDDKTIPVPGVHEVPDYVGGERVPFERPTSYITTHNDEVARALAKSTPNYEADAADEEWLDKLNNRLRNGAVEHLSVEKLEELIDMFERAAYRSPGVVNDESTLMSLCMNLERSDIVAAVYQYWLKKRKQKREALVKAFRIQAPRKVQSLPDRVLRRKRSLKKPPSPPPKRRAQIPLEAVADEAETIISPQDYENAKMRLTTRLELAAQKRKRAETLMENAELATYKALMALRIAEVAEMMETRDASTSSDLI